MGRHDLRPERVRGRIGKYLGAALIAACGAGTGPFAQSAESLQDDAESESNVRKAYAELQAEWSALAQLEQPELDQVRALEALALSVGEALAGSEGAGPELAGGYLGLALQVVGTFPESEGRLALFEAMADVAPHLGASTGHYIAHAHSTAERAEGRWSEACETLEEALVAYPEVSDYRALSLLMLVDNQRRIGRWETVEQHLEEAWRIIDSWSPEYRLGENQLRVRYHDVRGKVLLDWGLPDLAARAIDAQEAVAAELPPEDPAGRVSAALNRMNLYLKMNRYGRVVACADEALALGGGDAHVRLCKEIARTSVEFRAGITDGPARAELEGVLADPDLPVEGAITGGLRLAELALLEGDVAEAHEWNDGVREHLRGLLESDGAYDGVRETAHLRALECWTARIERNADALRRAHGELESSYASYLKSEAASPLRPGGIAFLQVLSNRMMLSELVDATRALEGEVPSAELEERALGHVFASQSLTSISRRLDARVPTLAEVREKVIPKGGGLLVYLPAFYSSHVWAIDRERVLHAPLGPGFLAESVQAELSLRLRDPSSSPVEIRALADELALAVLPPSIQRAVERWSSVTIIGADATEESAGLSFEVIALSDGETLGESKPLAHLASIPLALRLVERAENRTALNADIEVLVLASPTLSPQARERWPELAELPLSKAMEERLTDPFGSIETRIGPGANENLVTGSAGVQPSQVLHLLCHGVWDPTRERSATLLLAPEGASDGLLSTGEVEKCIAPPLTILSACGAARSPRRFGDDGIAHLGGAFLIAGSDTVLLPTGDLDYAATLEALGVVHRSLADGATPSEALRRARVHVAEDPRFGHPAYTAGWRIMGLGHRPLGVTAALAKPWFQRSEIRLTLLAALVLLGSAAAGHRRRQCRRSNLR